MSVIIFLEISYSFRLFIPLLEIDLSKNDILLMGLLSLYGK